MAQNKGPYRGFSDLSGLIYSTDSNFKSAEKKATTGRITLPPDRQDLRIQLARHKGNKVTTVIRDFVGRQEDLVALGRMLKLSCGTGGTVKAGEILLQGDKRQDVVRSLAKEGYKYKLVGG